MKKKSNSTSRKATGDRIKIDRKINIGELVLEYPELSQILNEDYGLHCVNCFAAGFDTLEEGAKIHGYDDKEIEKIINRLNKIVNNK